MKLARITFLGLVAFIGALAAATAAAAQPAHHRELCVGRGAGCYKTVQAAVDAARSGDTVRIGRGTFAGGVRIRASIHIVGAGARLTTIRGGGPVLTIGAFGAATEPSVSITGVEVTGGVTHSSAQSKALIGKTGVLALGGGIEVPPGHRFSDGATVTIRDSVITRNRVAPSASVPSGLPCGSACPFALAGGGGIDNWGSMTLTNTVVSDNRAGGPITSDADAGGIYTPQGHLTLRHSVVTRNRAVASRPYGRFAEGAGVNITSTPFFLRPRRRISTLTIDASRITANAATLADGFPSDVEAHANTGGVLIAGDDDCSKPTSGCVRGTIRKSLVSGNTASASNTAGDATAFSRRRYCRWGPRAERIHSPRQPRTGDGADRLHCRSLRRLGRDRHGRLRDDHRLAADRQLRQRQGTGRHRLGDVRGTQRRERSLRNHDQAQRHQPQPTRCIDHLGIGHPPGRRHRSPERRAARAP